MKVDGKSPVQSSNSSKPESKAPASDRFARILKDKEAAQNNPGSQSPLSGNASGFAPEDLLPHPASQEAFVSEDMQAPHMPAGQIDVQSLTAEMVQEIRGAEKSNGTQGLDVQFNSKTLAGLHVHLEMNSNKALSVTFSTDSDKVAALLTNQSGELRNALESHGLQVSGVVVTKGKTSGAPGDSRASKQRGGRR